jgi:probable DNA metabolism protein
VILAVRRIRDRVSKEINKLMGFIRFRKVADGIFYAAVSPDSNIVGFLGPHFSDRFADMAFLIHDVSRNLAWRHDPAGGSGVILLPELPADLKESLASESEAFIPALWGEYFRRIAIPERRNPGLQARLMPRRYWKHMTEMEDRVAGREPAAAKRVLPSPDA